MARIPLPWAPPLSSALLPAPCWGRGLYVRKENTQARFIIWTQVPARFSLLPAPSPLQPSCFSKKWMMLMWGVIKALMQQTTSKIKLIPRLWLEWRTRPGLSCPVMIMCSASGNGEPGLGKWRALHPSWRAAPCQLWGNGTEGTLEECRLSLVLFCAFFVK